MYNINLYLSSSLLCQHYIIFIGCMVHDSDWSGGSIFYISSMYVNTFRYLCVKILDIFPCLVLAVVRGLLYVLVSVIVLASTHKNPKEPTNINHGTFPRKVMHNSSHVYYPHCYRWISCSICCKAECMVHCELITYIS